MNREAVKTDFGLIATWLALPAGSWPPDHYTLLGLQPGECEVAKIEHSVHERLMRVRPYQLSHPLQATEAMMRLAKAFDCLTSASAKKAYDQAHFPHLQPRPPVLPSARVPTTVAADTTETTPVPSAPPVAPSPAPVPPPAEPGWWNGAPPLWQGEAAPPPVRQPGDSAVLPPPVRVAAQPPPAASAETLPPLAIPVGQPPAAPAIPAAAPAKSGPVPVAKPAPVADPQLEALRNSPQVREGIETRRGLYQRVLWLRGLDRAWVRAGRYLARPHRRLNRPVEESDLARALLLIEDALQDGHAPLGEPGQPGYRVVALAGQEPVIERFKALDEHHREALARDWNAGREALRAYRRLLHEQVRDWRRLGTGKRLRRVIDGLLTRHRYAVLVALSVATVLALAGVYVWQQH
jgi:hypothetical protein